MTFVLKGGGVAAAAEVYLILERKELFNGVTKNVSPSIFEIDPHHADKNLQAGVFNGGDTVSWRSSVSEHVWGSAAPAFLTTSTPHTRNTQPHFGGGNLCLCTQYRANNRICVF